MPDALERFWSKVFKDGPLVPALSSQCWEWTGAHDDQGHPRFKLNGVSTYANRARLVLEGKGLTTIEHVVTLCGSKSCVRPEHHVLGTPKDARALGDGGWIGPGDQYVARKAIVAGEIDIPTLATCYAISHQVAEAIARA